MYLYRAVSNPLEQERQWRERKCPIFKTVTRWDSSPDSLDCESGILPPSLAVSVLHFDHCKYIHAAHSALSDGDGRYFIPLAFNCFVEWLRIKAHTHPAIGLLGDNQVVNPVGWFVDTCDEDLLLKVTECLLRVVVPGVRDLPTVLNHWCNTAVHLDVVRLLVFADTGKEIGVDFKEAVSR